MKDRTHPVAPEEVMSFLEGELSADRSHAVSSHIEECLDCRKLRDSLENTSRAFAQWVVPAPPVAAGVKNAISSSRLAASLTRPSEVALRLAVSRRRAWAAVVASVTLVALAFLVLPYRMFRDRPEAASQPVGAYLGNPQTVSGSLDQFAKGSMGKLQVPQAQANEIGVREATQESSNNWVSNVALIARTVSLSIVVKDFDAGRTSLDALLARHNGYAASLNSTTPQGAARTLEASLRIPAPQLEAALRELKAFGRVAGESQSGEEVTEQHADLLARIKNDRETELRLQAILGTRTGKVKDVLEVEQEIARVRGEIEQMEAEQNGLEHRVHFATIELKLAEEYRAELHTPVPSALFQLRNATISGFRSAFGSVLALVLFLAESGPSLLVWLTLVGIPAWRLWRRYRRAQSLGSLAGASE